MEGGISWETSGEMQLTETLEDGETVCELHCVSLARWFFVRLEIVVAATAAELLHKSCTTLLLSDCIFIVVVMCVFISDEDCM